MAQIRFGVNGECALQYHHDAATFSSTCDLITPSSRRLGEVEAAAADEVSALKAEVNELRAILLSLTRRLDGNGL